MNAESPEDLRVSSPRWGAGAGLVFVLLFLTGFAMNTTPGSDATATEWAAFYRSGTRPIVVFLGTYLIVLSGPAFLWFLAGLRRSLEGRDLDGGAWAIASGCGVLYVAMLLVMAMVRATVAINVLFTDNDPRIGLVTVQTLDIVSGVLLYIAGALVAAVLIVLVSRLGRKTGVFPTWLTVSGYVAGALVALSFLYLPALALFVWVVLVSAYFITRPGGADADPSIPPALMDASAVSR